MYMDTSYIFCSEYCPVQKWVLSISIPLSLYKIYWMLYVRTLAANTCIYDLMLFIITFGFVCTVIAWGNLYLWTSFSYYTHGYFNIMCKWPCGHNNAIIFNWHHNVYIHYYNSDFENVYEASAVNDIYYILYISLLCFHYRQARREGGGGS